MPTSVTYKLEIAFATSPLSASPVWTDVTDYLEVGDADVAISRGRQDEFSDVQPGTMGFTLDNIDGRFTANNAASPYYPNVKKGKRVRFTVTVSTGVTFGTGTFGGGTFGSPGVTSIRFDGFINEWPTEWPGGGKQCLVRVTASDLLAKLGQRSPLRPFLAEEVFLGSPVAYYQLGEPEESTSAGDSAGIGASPLTITQVGSGGSILFGAGTGPGTDDQSTVDFVRASSANGKLLAGSLGQTLGGTWTLSAWINTGTQDQDVITLYGGTDAFVLNLQVGTGKVRLAHLYSSGSLYAETVFASSPNAADSATHLVTVEVTNQTTTKVWVDGVLVGTDASTFVWPANLFSSILLGGKSGYGTANLYNGRLSHVSIHAAAVGSSASTWYTAGTTGFAAEDADDRVDRIARYAGQPGITAQGSSFTDVASQAAGGETPLEAMRKVSFTENGLLFASRSDAPRPTFQARSYRYNAAVAFTLDASAEEIGADARFTDDDQLLRNDLTGTRSTGATQRWVNQPSIDAYGPYRDQLDGLWTTDGEVLAALQWVTTRYGDPPPRMNQVSIDAYPLRKRTNLAPNPSFEVDTAGWITFASTIARDTAKASSGSASCKVTADGTVTDRFGCRVFAGFSLAGDSAWSMRVAVWCNLPKIDTVRIHGRDHPNNDTFFTADVPFTPAAAWQPVSIAGLTVPSTRTLTDVYVLFVDSGGGIVAGDIGWVDALLVENEVSVGAYFDGSTGGAVAWTGTAHASKSTSGTSYEDVLAVDLSSLFRVIELPDQAPTPTADLFVEGYTERIGLGVHSFVMNTSPNIDTVWQLDSAAYSLLGSTTRLAY